MTIEGQSRAGKQRKNVGNRKLLVNGNVEPGSSLVTYWNSRGLEKPSSPAQCVLLNRLEHADSEVRRQHPGAQSFRCQVARVVTIFVEVVDLLQAATPQESLLRSVLQVPCCQNDIDLKPRGLSYLSVYLWRAHLLSLVFFSGSGL